MEGSAANENGDSRTSNNENVDLNNNILDRRCGDEDSNIPNRPASQEQPISDQQRLMQQQQQQQQTTATNQEVHTRETLFDFIALLQGRRMDDQRATLKPT